MEIYLVLDNQGTAQHAPTKLLDLEVAVKSKSLGILVGFL